MALKCIAGLIRPDEGRVELDGRILYDSASGIDLAPQKRSVGYLFQQYALFPNMTVRENILAGTKKLPHEARSSFAEEMIERFHLKGLENHYPAQLSGGQLFETTNGGGTAHIPGGISWRGHFGIPHWKAGGGKTDCRRTYRGLHRWK